MYILLLSFLGHELAVGEFLSWEVHIPMAGPYVWLEVLHRVLLTTPFAFTFAHSEVVLVAASCYY